VVYKLFKLKSVVQCSVHKAEPRSWFPLSVAEQLSRIPNPCTEIEFAPQRSTWFLPFALPALFVQRMVTTIVAKTFCIVHWILERLRFRPHNAGSHSCIRDLNDIPCAKQSLHRKAACKVYYKELWLLHLFSFEEKYYYYTKKTILLKYIKKIRLATNHKNNYVGNHQNNYAGHSNIDNIIIIILQKILTF